MPFSWNLKPPHIHVSLLPVVKKTLHTAGGIINKGMGGASSAGKSGVHSFDSAVSSAKKEFNKAKSEFARLEKRGENQLLKSKAYNDMKEYSGIVEELAVAWPKVAISCAKQIEVVSKAVLSRSLDSAAKEALRQIAEANELKKIILEAAKKSLFSFNMELSISAARGLGFAGGIGAAIGVPNLLDAVVYASAGPTLGASGGGSKDFAIGFSVSPPKDAGGPFVNIDLELVADTGGGLSVSLDVPSRSWFKKKLNGVFVSSSLPDLSNKSDLTFGGFMVSVGKGEKLNLSIGVGLTFLFSDN